MYRNISIAKKTVYLVLISCTAVILSSFDLNDGSDNNIIRLKALNDETTLSNDIPVYKKIEFVPLETNEDCLITTIFNMQFRDSLIYIHDFSNKLFVFDRNGHFVRQVGSIGQGPGEHIKINSFFFDEADQSIVIVDDMKRLFLYYDFDGNFKRKKDIPEHIITSISKSIIAGEDLLLINYIIWINNEDAYRLLKLSNMKILQSRSYNPIKSRDMMYPFSNHPIAKTNKGLNFILPLCDTIFNCYNGLFTPAYTIEHKQKMAPKEEYILSSREGENFYFLARNLGEKGYFTGFNSLHETENHIMLTFFCNSDDGFFACFLANKHTHEGRYYLDHRLDEKSKHVPISYNHVICSDKNSIVCKLNMDNLPFIREVLKKNKNPEMKEFKKLIEQTEDDDNPVLIFYTLDENY